MSLTVDLNSLVVPEGTTIEALLGQIFLLVKKERQPSEPRTCKRCDELKDAHRKYKILTQRKIEALEAQLQEAKTRLSQSPAIEVLAEDSVLLVTPKKKIEHVEEVPETQFSPAVRPGESERSTATNARCRLPETSKPRFKRDTTWITTQSQSKRDKKIGEVRTTKPSECVECEKFFENLDPGYSRELKKCSKHRQRPPPPVVPSDMWRTHMQDTPELIAQGLHEDTLPCDLRVRSMPRKKLLDKYR